MPKKKASKSKRNIRDQMKNRTEESSRDKDKGSEFGLRVLDLSEYEEVLFFTLKKGTNLIDIIPYEVQSKNHPRKLKKGDLDYVLDVWVHRRVGAADDNFVCLQKTYGKPCPVCEEMSQLKSDGADDSLIDDLKPSRRVFYNVIDLNSDEEKIEILEQSHYKFEREIIEEAETDGEGECIVFSDTEDGRSIEIKGREATFSGRKYIEARKFSLVEREEAYEEEIIDSAFPLDKMLNILSYDEMKDVFYGNESDDPDDNDEDDPDDNEEEQEKTTSKKKKKKKSDTKETTSKKSSKKKSKDECPHGHKFGDDCDEKKDCEDCEVWDACAEVNGE